MLEFLYHCIFTAEASTAAGWAAERAAVGHVRGVRVWRSLGH